MKLRRQIEVDGKIITNQNVSSWQRLIGYVPQNIYLSDDTVAANIAFGEQEKNINQENIVKVSKIANLHKFIDDELPQKYETMIGERELDCQVDKDNVLELQELYIMNHKFWF